MSQVVPFAFFDTPRQQEEASNPMALPIISFDYDFSPYGQKIKMLLTACNIPFQKCDQPLMLPRLGLEALGITHRRIPLLAIGKDIYVDSSRIIDEITNKLAEPGIVPTSLADSAFEAWGARAFLEPCQGLVDPELLTPAFVQDRRTLFPFLTRPDLSTVRPSGLAGLKARLNQVEHVFLAGTDGPFMSGKQLHLADLHVIFGLRWALFDLGVIDEPGFSKDVFPKVYRLIESLPSVSADVLTGKEAHEKVNSSGYWEQATYDVASDDELKIALNEMVTIESFDAEPGSHFQVGRLIGTNANEVVIEVGQNGVRLHFPKIGYIVRPQADSAIV